MKSLRFIALGCALLAVLAAAPAATISVPKAQIDAENARWAAFGVKLPPGGVVLAHPYAPPYSNRSFVVPYAWYRRFSSELGAKKDVPVSAAALRADLPVLHLLLRKAYAGYRAASKSGWNWNAMFRNWNAQLARSGTKRLSLRAAFAPWNQLQTVEPDNESGIPGFTAFSSGSESSELAKNPRGACSLLRLESGRSVKLRTHDAAEQPHAVQAWDGAHFTAAWYVSYPKRFGHAEHIVCGGRTIALMRTAVVAAGKTAVYRTLRSGVAYVRLPTFTAASKRALRAALSKAPQLGKERLVMFDLRGNAGGTIPSELLTNWFAESAVEIAGSLSETGTRSCFETALFFGDQQQFTANLKAPISDGLKQVLQQLVDSLKGSSTPHCQVQLREKRADHDLAQHHFTLHASDPGQTRVVVLVDSGCSNACEYLTYVLAGLPDTVIAGTNTYGDLGFSHPGYFVLPHSQVPFRLALQRTDPYGDGRSVDGYGLSVDVLLPTAQSQSMQSLSALAELLSN